jgi:K+-transporting ATPase ATPase C chain
MLADLRRSVVAVLAATILLGLAYPLALTGAGQALFGERADGQARLIGVATGRPGDLQPRPSVTGYAPDATAFSNRGPNQASTAVQQRRFALDYAAREGIRPDQVPADAATTSASGVDPHVSPRNARIQARRIARVRGLPLARVLAVVEEHTDGRGLGVFGEPGVNVHDVNAALGR